MTRLALLSVLISLCMVGCTSQPTADTFTQARTLTATGLRLAEASYDDALHIESIALELQEANAQAQGDPWTLLLLGINRVGVELGDDNPDLAADLVLAFDGLVPIIFGFPRPPDTGPAEPDAFVEHFDAAMLGVADGAAWYRRLYFDDDP